MSLIATEEKNMGKCGDVDVVYPCDARFEFRIISNSLIDPAYYLIDRVKLVSYAPRFIPDPVLDMMFSMSSEFVGSYKVLEEPDGWEPLCPKYGSYWKLCIPKEEKWWKGHPRLRRLFQEMPGFFLELNSEGVSRYHMEYVLKPLYTAAASS